MVPWKAFGIQSLFACGLLIAGAMAPWFAATPASQAVDDSPVLDRSPVDVVLTPDGRALLCVNQSSGTVSLIDKATGTLLDEVACGERPSTLAITPDGKRICVGATWSGELTVLSLSGKKLKLTGRVHLGFEPRGVAVTPDGRRAFVALTTAHALAEVDLNRLVEVRRIPVGKWPRYLALSRDGKTLAVGANGDGGVSVVDAIAGKLLYQEEFAGLNLGQMHLSADGKYVYFPWMVYRHNPITPGNVRLGWVLASRIARVRLDGKARREAISLDPPGKAIADPHGLALSPDETTMVCAASGTHELLVYRLPGLPFQDYGGPGDHIDKSLAADANRFYRIPLGGRPMGVCYDSDGQNVYVANYLLNAIQVVDVPGRKIARTIPLGGLPEPSLARKGEAIFYDGQRSLDQWYSCHSCHYEGHTNAVAMDTRNDGRFGNFKTVLSLRDVVHRGAWFWHGWEKDLDHGLARSITESMLGKEPSREDVEALRAFLATLTFPPNPHRETDGRLSESAQRGEKIFQSEKAGCYRCHGGPYFTDGKPHEVGLASPGDVYRGFRPPSLRGTYDRVLYLHDGRSTSLEEVLKGPHSAQKITGKGELTETEIADLIAYLKAL